LPPNRTSAGFEFLGKLLEIFEFGNEKLLSKLWDILLLIRTQICRQNAYPYL